MCFVWWWYDIFYSYLLSSASIGITALVRSANVEQHSFYVHVFRTAISLVAWVVSDAMHQREMFLYADPVEHNTITNLVSYKDFHKNVQHPSYGN